MNFKTNKTKLIAKIMLLVLLVTSAFSFSGCGEPHVKKGQYYSVSGTPYNEMALKVVSDTKKFSLYDVTLQLYVGLHRQKVTWLDLFFHNENKSENTTEKPIEIPDCYKNYCYLIYVHDYRLAKDDDGDHAAEIDFTNENLHVFKEISYKESFNDKKYTYKRSPKGKYYFNYVQTITISEDAFLENSGTIMIIIALVEKLDDQNARYSQPHNMMAISMSYVIEDDGTLTLGFGFRK